MSDERNGTWYRAGRACACAGRGPCGAGPGAGYVWVVPEEAAALAAHLGESGEVFAERYTRRVGWRRSLREEPRGQDCVFLERPAAGGRRCAVYEVRPAQCRTWPFWRENLASAAAWGRAAANCPGMNRGIWYGASTIEAIRDGDVSAWSRGGARHEAAGEWIARQRGNVSYLAGVADLYAWIDREAVQAGGWCANCGECCDFEGSGHRLFVTTLEAFYFREGMRSAGLRERPAGERRRCPYRNGRGCLARAFRPSGCRIFHCRGLDTDLQSELTEEVLRRLRRLHEQWSAVYYYADLLEWLARWARGKGKETLINADEEPQGLRVPATHCPSASAPG